METGSGVDVDVQHELAFSTIADDLLPSHSVYTEN